MRFFALAFFIFGFPASADESSLSKALEARKWAFEIATCENVRSLFRIEPQLASDVTERDSISLLFVSMYIQGYAAGEGRNYANLLVEWGKFCSENPALDWRDFPGSR